MVFSNRRRQARKYLFLLLSVMLLDLGMCGAFTFDSRSFGVALSQSRHQQLQHQQQRCFAPKRSSLHASSEDRGPSKPTDDREALTDLDARVLQSMLQDSKKLDLQTEDNLRKLLERGTKKKEVRRPRIADMDDSEFQSTVLKKLSDTKLWQVLKRRADDVLETVSIYVANRIERDSKLAISLSVFFGDRIKRDVARALPSRAEGVFGAKVKQKASRQLGSSSSFADMQEVIKREQEEEAAERRKQRDVNQVDAYDEFNTPLDEIRSVTQSIRDILRGETVTPSSSSSSSSVSSSSSPRRGLRSVAQGGNSRRGERQQRAYQKRKATTFKRERETVDVGRAVGSIADSAWQVKRELEVETNQPGYKTETVRAAIEAGAETTANFIAAAKEDPTNWRKQLGQAIFGRKDEKEQSKVLQAAETVDVSAVMDKTVEADDRPKVDKGLIKEDVFEVSYVEDTTKDFETLLDDEYMVDSTFLDENGDVDIDKFVKAEIAKIDLKFEIPEIKLPDVEIPIIPEEPQLNIPELSVPIELIEERESALERLRSCIDKPQVTWLTPDVIETVGASIDDNALREVVTAMICARDDLEASSASDDAASPTVDEYVDDLKQVKRSIDMVNSLAASAAGYVAAERLRNILYGIDEEDAEVRPTLEILDEIRQTYDSEVKEVIETAQSVYQAAVEYRQKLIDVREAAILEQETLIAEAQAERERLIAEAEIALEEAKADAVQRGITKAQEYRILREEALERGKKAAGEAKIQDIQAKIQEVEATKMSNDRDAVVTGGETGLEELQARIRETEAAQRTGVVTNDPMAFAETQVMEPVDVAVESFQTAEMFVNGDSGTFVELVVDEDDSSAVAVEVISDSDIDEKFGEARVAVTMDELEEEVEEKEPNLFIKVSLRSLDVLLVVVEKIITLLPDLTTSGMLASKRIEEIGRGGMGSKGWQKIKNINSGERRY